jgi:double-strand break repair protein MRE11
MIQISETQSNPSFFAPFHPLKSGDDSFETFEEVLQIAKEQKVDFVLLGGDLFHENKPSSRSLTKCIDLLRKYTLGDDPVCFQVVSDQQVNFAHSSTFRHVNFEDANLNVSLPVFSIHGNHDDPNTRDAVSVLDTLAAAGLVNYFGKQSNMDALRVSPVMLVKGDLQLALYGIGSLPEERFHRYIADGRVQFLAMEQPDEWFKLFVVHQNRVKHGNKYLPEHCLTDLPDFVLWGHEHESFTKADFNSQNNFYVYQPGSTVATSLCPAESAPKHVGLLTVKRHSSGDFRIKLDPIRLQTVRPFYFQIKDLDEHFAQVSSKLVPGLFGLTH